MSHETPLEATQGTHCLKMAIASSEEGIRGILADLSGKLDIALDDGAANLDDMFQAILKADEDGTDWLSLLGDGEHAMETSRVSLATDNGFALVLELLIQGEQEPGLAYVPLSDAPFKYCWHLDRDKYGWAISGRDYLAEYDEYSDWRLWTSSGILEQRFDEDGEIEFADDNDDHHDEYGEFEGYGSDYMWSGERIQPCQLRELDRIASKYVDAGVL